jgi:mono/diheme cytochrome c family protein
MIVRVAGLLLAFVELAIASSGIRGQASAPDPASFATRLYPVLREARCSGCHAQDGVASATRLHFPPKDATQAQIEDFGLSLAPLVDRADWANSLLLKKPTRMVPHTGGERIRPGSADEKLLAEWVQYLASASDERLAAARRSLGDVAEAGPKQLVRRLTHSQYNNTVRDLLGDYSRPANRFPEEDFVDGFKNQLAAQGMPPLLVETYSTSAERLALNAFRIGDVNGLVPCKAASADDDTCRDAFIHQFGLKAFRRPLGDDELRRYGAIFGAQAKATRTFLEGARVVVEAMLQSPNFLFHVEGGPDGMAVDHDVASRLSYLLWNTMPDAALFDAAAKGELKTSDGRMKAARRMIDDPRAKQAVDEFFDEWLRLDRVQNAVKARAADFTPEVAAAMAEETRTLLQYLVWNDKSFMEALTADYTFVSSDLAALYKVPAPPGEFEMVKLPATAHRAGILGHGSFLASTAGPTATSPTSRGIFIRERLLCQHVPPPPPGVNQTLPEPTDPTSARTRRQLMTAHVENATCASCHRLMDPIGFGLENFDAIGRWRDKETIVLPGRGAGEGGGRGKANNVALSIDTQGEIAGIPNSTFSDATQAGRILAGSPVCQKCIVRQMFRYSYGRLETGADEATIDRILARFKDSGFRFKALLLGLVESPEFVRRF